MVGDSGTDIQTARNAGIPIIAVSWGFRPRHELTSADYIADSTAALGSFNFASLFKK
jgi:phosphoglycolate phosphatase